MDLEVNKALYRKWFLAGLVNLCLVALWGTTMRYKMVFDFPILNQKFLLHAHSHFAFTGWVSHFIYTGLAMLICNETGKVKQRKYNTILIVNLISAYGMLIAFSLQGYKAVSITFSTLSLVVAVWFSIVFIRDSRLLPSGNKAKPWAVTGAIFNSLSIFGPFFLAYLMASKNDSPDMTLNSIHYFLHFQYNGWFFFGTMALVITILPKSFPDISRYCGLFAFAIIPTYFLSVFGIKIPMWLYLLVILTTLLQLILWVVLVTNHIHLIKTKEKRRRSNLISLLLYTVLLAMTIKFVLQALALIPSLNAIIFVFRPIIIAYLHLVLLGVFSLYIFAHAFYTGYFNMAKSSIVAAVAFIIGVILNEVVLAIQGLSYVAVFDTPFINEILLGISVLLLASAVALFISQTRSRAIPIAFNPSFSKNLSSLTE